MRIQVSSKSSSILVNEECLSVFPRLKEALISDPMMQAADWELPFKVMCNANDFALGVLLGQKRDNKSYVIYYASHTLNEAQINYATTKKEFLTICVCLEKVLILFNQFQGHCFHKPCSFKASHKEIQF